MAVEPVSCVLHVPSCFPHAQLLASPFSPPPPAFHSIVCAPPPDPGQTPYWTGAAPEIIGCGGEWTAADGAVRMRAGSSRLWAHARWTHLRSGASTVHSRTFFSRSDVCARAHMRARQCQRVHKPHFSPHPAHYACIRPAVVQIRRNSKPDVRQMGRLRAFLT